MIKFSGLALMAALAFSVSSVSAHDDKACCATTASGHSKEACVATFAKLDLNAEQKAKMETLAEDCVKGGCNKETMAKMEKGAKGILSKEQFAAWKAECSGKMHEKTQS
jgi:hypothetical protein